MREIKFRIWDKTRNKMLTSNCGEFLLTQEGNAVFHQNGDNPLEALIEQIEYEVLQYTGLKDKNGTEIYEGDIVKYTSELENGIFEVKYSNCRFYGLWIEANFMDITTDLFYLGCSNELEVIGNIYQNPELLEDVDNE